MEKNFRFSLLADLQLRANSKIQALEK